MSLQWFKLLVDAIRLNGKSEIKQRWLVILNKDDLIDIVREIIVICVVHVY